VSRPEEKQAAEQRSQPTSFEALSGLPKCSVIVPHFNYSHLVENALKSVMNQDHASFECIVIDDCSAANHVRRLERILGDLNDDRFILIKAPRNLGQTEAVYEALAHTATEFVALLDPDDIYAPSFLSGMLRAHLNRIQIAALATCDMGLYRVGGSRLSHVFSRFSRDAHAHAEADKQAEMLERHGYSAYYPPWTPGWLWCATSSLMFRRDALELIRPRKPLNYQQVDAFCAQGAHMFGGTLFVNRVLSYRGLHGANLMHTPRLFSAYQQRHERGVANVAPQAKRDALNAFFANDGHRLFQPERLLKILQAHLDTETLASMIETLAEKAKLEADASGSASG
jgi:glycosyltransferase involved in cell wall biosynthesis